MEKKLTGRQYLTIRLALWGIAVFIAMLPALMGIDSWHELWDADAYRDVLFVVVPVSALALSTTFDYLCVGYPDLSASAFFNSIGGIILNGIGLTTGLTGFVSIKEGTMTLFAFWTYSALICFAVFVSLATEVIVSRNHHVFRSN